MKKVDIDGLLALTPEQIEIVFRHCRGEKNRDIAKIADIPESSFYVDLRAIYKLLEISGWDDLDDDFCVNLVKIIQTIPALKRGWPEEFREKIEALREPEEPREPMPSPVPPLTPRPTQSTQRIPLPWLLIALPLLLVCAACGFAGWRIVLPAFQNVLTPVEAIQSPTPPLSTDVVTIQPTNTEAVVIASQTSIPTASETISPPTPTIPPPTATLTPTETITPYPPGFTFFDDFNDGLDPFWIRRFGTPLIVSERLTSSEPLVIYIGDASWKNYQIEFDFVGEFNDCNIGPNSSTLGVRAQDQDNMIVYVFSRCYQEWERMVDGKWTPIPDTLHGGLRSPIYFIFVVEGNKITVHNRSELLSSIIVEGYPSGPIYLTVKPGAQFDNFKVTILP